MCEQALHRSQEAAGFGACELIQLGIEVKEGGDLTLENRCEGFVGYSGVRGVLETLGSLNSVGSAACLFIWFLEPLFLLA